MYSTTPAKRNMRLYKLRSTSTRAASQAVHKILELDRRVRKTMKKSGGSNMALRIGPVIENLEEISSFGIGKTNLRIDATWANTTRHRGIGEGYTAIPKFFGKNRRGLTVCTNLANWDPHKLYDYISDTPSDVEVNAARGMPTEHIEIFEKLMTERAIERYGEGDISAGGTMTWNCPQLEEFFTAKEHLSPGSERDAEHESLVDGDCEGDEGEGEYENAQQRPTRDLAQAGIHGHPQR